MISGLPGTGKTYGMKTLNPKETFFIDADGKGTSWAGGSKQYNPENKNCIKSNDTKEVMEVLRVINEMKHIKQVVISTVSELLTAKEMRERKKAGFDKICRIKTPLIAGNSLEFDTLQRNHEIWISVIV